MNEKIQQLMDQSFTDEQGERFDPERFAKLIVRECARLADDVSVSGPPRGCTYGDVIHEHFGIEA
jgi:hypothetical protein